MNSSRPFICMLICYTGYVSFHKTYSCAKWKLTRATLSRGIWPGSCSPHKSWIFNTWSCRLQLSWPGSGSVCTVSGTLFPPPCHSVKWKSQIMPSLCREPSVWWKTACVETVFHLVFNFLKAMTVHIMTGLGAAMLATKSLQNVATPVATGASREPTLGSSSLMGHSGMRATSAATQSQLTTGHGATIGSGATGSGTTANCTSAVSLWRNLLETMLGFSWQRLCLNVTITSVYFVCFWQTAWEGAGVSTVPRNVTVLTWMRHVDSQRAPASPGATHTGPAGAAKVAKAYYACNIEQYPLAMSHPGMTSLQN